MGPLATVDFFRKVVEETHASIDQEHIPLIIDSVPSIPCRVAAIMRDGQSPVPEMLGGIRRLRQAGAECVAIACNTAHYWYDTLQQECDVPILHIVDAVAAALPQSGSGNVRIGLLATEATIAANIYPSRLSGHGVEFIVNSPEIRSRLILPAIALVKSGKPEQAGALVEEALEALQKQGVQQSVLACTELPVALEATRSACRNHCVDATRALARAAVAWSLDYGRQNGGTQHVP